MAEKEMQSADVCTHKNKIKTRFAKIFVSGTPDRPYFNILYFDPVDQDYHVGFSSYCLEYVFKWLSEEFEIEDDPAANGAPLYGWHISDLHIYNEARELSEFTGLRNTRFGAAPYDIKRPPQSWCYVEEDT